jgi:ElaB/YqjD/DUF883 family membrane-anchored ribosome-binding protein
MNDVETHGSVKQRSEHDAQDDSLEIEELRQRIQSLQDDFAQADKRLRAVVRERPFLALGAAIAAGFLLGRIIGRA